MKISGLTNRWNLLGVVATAICTCVGGFLVFPAIDYGNEKWAHLGVFLTTILVALWLVPVTLWTSKRLTPVWLGLTVFFVATATYGYFVYDEKMDAWIFEYGTKLEIAGDQLTIEGQKAKNDVVQSGRSPTNHAIAWEMGADFAATWVDNGSRERRFHWLMEIYILDLLLFASGVVSAVQTSFSVVSSTRDQRGHR